MTKDILLIRHAHAESSIHSSDFDRNLTPNGILDAEKMSQKMLQRGVIPEFIMSSPAKRAMKTTRIFAQNTSIPFNKIQPENMIYEAGVSTLLSLINHLDNAYSVIALFGHNPGLSELADYLSDEYVGNIPTAGIVHLQFEEDDWKLITGGTGHLKWKAYPNLSF